ncbi:MAG: ABC transporter ATP-binding protein [Clostridiales bacterium]|nr:ABC transporter ATP-binding protein [Clostridiales bacterium]
MISIIRKIAQRLKSHRLQQLLKEAVWIKRRLARYKLSVIVFMVTGLLGALMSLVASVVSKYLIDAVTGHQTALVGIYAILILIAAIISIIVKAATSRYFARVSIRIHNEMQSEMFNKILDADWEEISRYHSGDLLNRLSSDLATISSGILSWFPSLVIQLATLISSLGILLYFDPAMSLIAGACAPLSLLLSKLIMKRLKSYNSRMRQAGSEIMAFEEEALSNLQMIKCFNLASVFSRRMRDIQSRYLDLSIEYNKFSVFASSFLSIVGLMASYAAFGWGVYRLWTGAISYGTMILFLQQSAALSGAFSSLTGLVPGAVDLLTCTGRIIDIYELKNEIEYTAAKESGITADIDGGGLSLELQDLDFAYRDGERVLKKACLHAKSGELLAIIGPSGEGKSTLLKIMLGLLKPASGIARLINQSGVSLNISASTRRYFSYVPQGNSLLSGTIADNLRLAKTDATDEELIAALEAADAYSFVRELPDGIYTRIGERGLGLSEGQAQRIAIARALLRRAPVLLLDEATSALDAQTEARVLKGLMEYDKSNICIFATHRSNILAECKSIYRISNSQLTRLKDGNKTRSGTISLNENTKLA